MGQHGFGTALIGSQITPKAFDEIAEKISELPGIVMVYVIKHKDPPRGLKSMLGEGPNYNIMFQFDHVAKHGKTHAKLLREIDQIIKNSGYSIHFIDLWIIQNSHEG